ncbi:unnamed protein product [Linum trigynum]|uniref:WD repeat and HMG-box DNA-binding protein 1 n=1 Tax=Linum trigynum TaxID=586398 RepID=A0AAV2EZS3_9ROSI
MKIRTLKLREAHKPSPGYGAANGSSFCSILWDQQARHLVTASSSDSGISIHDALLPSTTPKILRHHRDGVTALALSPNSTCLASGSIDNSVKLYRFPGGEFETNITRFTLPIRALAFNQSGSMLAAAGDDDGIKLINTVDGSIARVLKGHKGSVTGLAFDPMGEYLASVDSMGTVLFWELQSGTILHTLKGVAPNTGLDTSLVNILSWSPDGEMLAVPGLKNDVVMYDRDTAEKVFTLRGDHLLPLCFLSWSPNGKYMATSGLDRQVLIWDVLKKQDIDRQKFEDRICCMAWKPVGNTLAVVDVSGKYGLWESVIPSSMKSPTDDIPQSSKKSNGLMLFEEEGQEPCSSGSLGDLGEDSVGESGPPSRKRIRKRSEFDEDDPAENTLDGFGLLPQRMAPKRTHYSAREHLDKGSNEELRSTAMSVRSKMQEAFQPGVTPVQPGKRRFLCYNMLGTITTMEYDGYSHIEIDFHDTSRGPRVPAMTDHFGFTMACLNENGSVFANPCKGDKNMSTLMYRPFSSWANNSEWSMRFEGEEVKVVALGVHWVAAITSLNYLRIFTEGGLQKHILSLDGPAVTASGSKNQLAVVTHASSCLPSSDQVLEFQVFDIRNGTRPSRGRLPLSPGSHLIWFGFSEEGLLSSYDSKGVLRVFTSQYGGSWLPLFSANKTKKSDENYWVVGLNANKLFCIVCKSTEVFPQVMPKPILTLLDLSFPLASSDLGADVLENEFILNNLHLFQIQKRIEESSSDDGRDTTELDDEAFSTEAAQDRCILRLIASCCNSDKLVRATELVKLLTLEKSMKGAIKLVTALKLPNLADRFNSILEERMLIETKGMSETAGVAVSQGSGLARNGTASEVPSGPSCIPSSSTTLSAPRFFKKVVNRGEQKGRNDHNLQTAREVQPEVASSGGSTELRTAAAAGTQELNGTSNPFLKSSSNGPTKETTSQRPPSNPFKKSAK